MQIREADRSDLKQIAHVAKTSYVDAFGEYFKDKDALEKETQERRSEKYFESIFETDQILVAVDNELIVGYLQFGVPTLNIELKPNSIELKRLYVLTQYHSKGFGKALLNSMLAHNKLSNIHTIYLEVWPKNEKAVNLYKSFGFVDTGHKRPFYENGIEVGFDSVYELTLSN
ncbi:MAG: N-acetyltransferase [Acidimicrobiia bacterium]